MKYLFYKDWAEKRISKIENIFGKDWFRGKNILEVGCAHGDIGKHFLRLGAHVTFSDARNQYLDLLSQDLREYNYDPDTVLLDQNKEWDLERRFDLIIHMGLLYHIQDWKLDLQCALRHTSTMVLESIVDQTRGAGLMLPGNKSTYGPYNCENSVFSQEEVEEFLVSEGCKFIRFDNSDLNSYGWDKPTYASNKVYDWNYTNCGGYERSASFRRFWLILK